MLLGTQSMTARGRPVLHASSLGKLHASRPTAICSDVMAVCSVQNWNNWVRILITYFHCHSHWANVDLMIGQRNNSVRLQDNIK